jgi:hypothetical protein
VRQTLTTALGADGLMARFENREVEMVTA